MKIKINQTAPQAPQYPRMMISKFGVVGIFFKNGIEGHYDLLKINGDRLEYIKDAATNLETTDLWTDFHGEVTIHND